jgi:hypothetical protein
VDESVAKELSWKCLNDTKLYKDCKKKKCIDIFINNDITWSVTLGSDICELTAEGKILIQRI